MFTKTNTKAASKRCHCPENITPKVLIASPGCSNDDAVIAALPEELEVRHSGPILANYLKERKQKHENLLEDLADGAAIINHNVDAKIQELSEQLLYYIKRNEKDMDCTIEKCNSSENSLDVKTRNYLLKQINNLYNKRLEDMADFRKNALKLEKERADGLRNLFKQQFQRFVTVGHKTPKELLHDFDDRIYGINQQLLSNIRAYGELDAELRAQADKYVVELKSCINQLCLGIGRAYRTRSAQRYSRNISVDSRGTRRSSSASDRMRNSSTLTKYSDRREIRSIDLILGGVLEIEKCVNELVEAYRQAVLKILTGFTGKLVDLHKDLANYVIDETWWKSESTQLKEMIERALRGMTNCYYKKVSSSTVELVDLIPNDAGNMQKSLWSLGERLRDTYALLNDAGRLLDSHMMRSAHAQKLTMTAVEDLLSNNDIIEQADEVNFSLALEQMYAAPDVEKLQQYYDVLTATLNNIENMYQEHRTAEIGRLEEFMNLVPIMTDTLLSEFAYYLEKYPINSIVMGSILNLNTISPRSTPIKECNASLRSPIPRAILQTELQEAALKNWRNGFLETFETNMSLVPGELTSQAREWVNERTAILHMRYNVKLSSHSVRKERIKALYDLRLTQLKYHESRLQSHLDAIYSLVDSLPKQVREGLKMEAPVLFPLSQWLKRISKDMSEIMSKPDVDPEIIKLKMNSYAPRLTKYRQLFETSLDEAINLYKKHVEQKIQEARVSNVRFMSNIKLFGEGGNYSAMEAMKTSAILVHGAEALEICESSAMDASSSCRAQLSAIADEELLPLRKIVNDFLKISVKPTANKPVKKR